MGAARLGGRTMDSSGIIGDRDKIAAVNGNKLLFRDQDGFNAWNEVRKKSEAGVKTTNKK